jgi:hypothetical protein
MIVYGSYMLVDVGIQSLCSSLLKPSVSDEVKASSKASSRGRAKAARAVQPQFPAEVAVGNAGNYASKVKDWRKNRFQKDREVLNVSNVSSGPGDAAVKASKKRKNAAVPVPPVPVESKISKSQKRKAADGSPKKASGAKLSKFAKGKAKVETKTKTVDVSSKASKKKRTGGSTKGRAEELQEGTGVISEMKFQSLKLHESLRRQLEYLNFTES